MRDFSVYIMTNRPGGVLYIGITNTLRERVREHRLHIKRGFADRYNLERLVYYDRFADPGAAIRRQKQLKRWNRQWKIDLINEANPAWQDLWDEIVDDQTEAPGRYRLA